MDKVLAFFHVASSTELAWVVFGIGGQLLFSARFIIQWIASEKSRKSVVPVAFWYFSMAGAWCCLPMPATAAIRYSFWASRWAC